MAYSISAEGAPAAVPDFDTLFETYQTEALRAAYLICGNRADAEDVVQDTFVKCYESMSQLHDPTRVKAWLFRILTRTAWRACQKHRREMPVETLYDSQEPTDEDASAPLLRDDRAQTVRRALQTGDWNRVRELVPETTYSYFRNPEAAPVLERIRAAENVVHY